MLMFQARWGYRKENCRTGKIDILASSLQSCSFLTANTSSRCSPSKSAALANSSSNIGLLAQSLIDTYEEECPSNCEYLRFYRFKFKFRLSPLCSGTLCPQASPVCQTRWNRGCGTLSPPAGLSTQSFSGSTGIKDDFEKSCFRFSMTSMDLTTIKNRPQPFIQVTFVLVEFYKGFYSSLWPRLAEWWPSSLASPWSRS